MIKKKKKKYHAKPVLEPSSPGNAPPTPFKPLIDTINHTNGIYFLFSAIFLIQLFIFKDYIFFKKLYLFLDAGGDSYNLFYPAYVHNARYLRVDGIPTWSFYQGMGGNIFPGGISSPFGLILNIIGPDKLAYGIVYVELLKMLLTGLFFYMFLRLLNFSKYTCITGGILASFLGYLVLGSSGWYGHSTNVVYFVLLLYSFELFYTKNNPIMFPVAVFFVSGDPFRLYLQGVFLLTYSLLRLLSDQKFSFKESVIFLLKLAGLGLIGVGMGVIFSFGALLGMINSPRVSGNVKAVGSLVSVPVFGLSDRLQWVTEIMRLFSNDLMGTGSKFAGWKNYLGAPVFYAGLLPLLLAPQVFFLKNRRKRLLFAGFLFIWIIPVVFPFFRYALYVFMGDYYKHGLSLFIPVILLLCGLYGLENIEKKTTLNYIILLITLLVLIAVLFFPFFEGTPYAEINMINNSLRIVIGCFLLLYTGIICFLQFESLKPYVKGVLLLLMCVEAGYFSSITVNHRKTVTLQQFESKVGYNDDTVDAINYLKSIDSGFYRVNKDYSSTLAEVNSINDAKIQGYFGTPSYSSFNKQAYIDFLEHAGIIEKGQEDKTRWALGLLQRPFLQAISSVKYNLLKNKDLAAKGLFFKTVYAPIKRFNDITVFKNNFSLPLGFTYDKSINTKDYLSLTQTRKDMAMFDAVVTDLDLPGIQRMDADEMRGLIKKLTLRNFIEMVAQKKTDAMKMTYFSQKDIKGEITLEKRKLLFFSIPFDNGWKAFDNGNAVQMIKANIGFMGIMLDKGRHEIELKYRIQYIRVRLGVSIIALLIYLAMVFWKINKNKELMVHKDNV